MQPIAARGLVILLVGALATGARAMPQGPGPLPTFVGGESSCPDPSTVATETVRLTPLDQRALYTSGVRVQLTDLGDSYQVRIFAPGLLAEKTYVDQARDCDRRTTFAAVLVLMTLMPPQLAQPSTESEPKHGAAEARAAEARAAEARAAEADSKSLASAPPPGRPRSGANARARAASAAHSAPQKAAREPHWVRLSFGLSGTWSPPVAQAFSTKTLGLTLKSSLGRNAFAPVIAFSYASESSFELNGIGGTVRRLPVYAGLEWRPFVSAFDLRATLGALAVLERIRSKELVVVQSQSTVEYGARTGISAAWGTRPLTPFVGLYLDWYPAPLEIRALPRGNLGTTPAMEVWTHVGAQFGL